MALRNKWRKIPQDERGKAEDFLRERELFCVAASSRFSLMEKKDGHIWYLSQTGDDVSALLLHHRRILFPVFDKNPRVPGPRFLNRFLGKVPIHALQGLREDAEILEALMSAQGYFPAERIDYDLMSLDSVPKQGIADRPAPRGLVIRPPIPKDTEALFALQSAYEQEEVLPANGVYNPAVSRHNLEHLLSREYVIVAELDGQVVGKMNTSAASFTRYQIGGVYVRPDCRGRGIGLNMTSVFAENVLSGGRGLTLFVKKRNAAARAVYRKAGFNVLGDYRITYY